MPIDDCYALLGVTPDASASRVAAAFRRLAKRYHPDVNPRPDARRRFVEIVQAYDRLRATFRDHPADEIHDYCPRCGRAARLLDGLDGGLGCAECLLGQTRRRRFLPLPQYRLVLHLGVFALYAVSTTYLVLYLRGNAMHHAASSVLAALTGMALLAHEVFSMLPPMTVRRRRSIARR